MTPVSETTKRRMDAAPADQSSVLGECLLENSAQLRFPDGLVGCPAWRDFAVRAKPEHAPILELECLSEPGISLLAVAPQSVTKEYAFEVGDAERRSLELDPDEQPAVLVLLVVRGKPPRVTANLAGPLIVNARAMLGRQLVLDGEQYSLRHPVSM